MGLFGTRKDTSREQPLPVQESPTSPSHAGRKGSSSGIPRLANLFADAEGGAPCRTLNADVTGADCFTAPTVDMDDFDTKAAVHVKDVTPALNCPGLQDVDRKLSLISPSLNQRTRERSVVRQGSIMERASSISRMAQRDSIKRSVSRKIARSESRRQSLNLGVGKENHDVETQRDAALLSMSQPSGDSEGEAEKITERLSVSRSSSLLKGNREGDNIVCTKNNEETNSAGQNLMAEHVGNFDRAYGEDDIFLLEEATRNDFDLKGGNTEAGCNVKGVIAPSAAEPRETNVSLPNTASREKDNLQNQSPEVNRRKPGKVRKRPPPLVNADCEKSSGDSTSDWLHTTVFGKDGGFATGGFKITSEGMVGKPLLATREDSDPQADGEVPQSDRNLVIVRSLKEFRAGPTIGAGAAGRVYLAEHMPSKRTMAMKVVNVYDKEKRNQLLKELETLCTYVSRYLVRFYGAFYDGSGAVHIALEYMDHGCLATFVQRVGAIPEKVVQMIAVDCLRGLGFLHRNHVLHRDFKTANILMSRRLCCAKLSDFGLARDLNPGVSRVETFVGTVAYMSPERLQGSKYTYASDIWALGVSVVECLLGRYPFNRPQNYFDYIEATMTSNIWGGFEQSGIKISAQARDFVTQCTHTEANRRPDAARLLDHPWISQMKKDRELFGTWLDQCRIISMRTPVKSGAARNR